MLLKTRKLGVLIVCYMLYRFQGYHNNAGPLIFEGHCIRTMVVVIVRDELIPSPADCKRRKERRRNGVEGYFKENAQGKCSQVRRS